MLSWKLNVKNSLLLKCLFIISGEFLALMSLVCVNFCRYPYFQKVPSHGAGAMGFANEKQLQSNGGGCPLQPPPQHVSVHLLHSYSLLSGPLNVSDLPQMFSAERSNAVFCGYLVCVCNCCRTIVRHFFTKTTFWFSVKINCEGTASKNLVFWWSWLIHVYF